MSTPKSLLLIVSVLLLGLSTAVAENVYRWENDQGQVFFGSKAPAGAKNVRQVEQITISRYSSDRVVSANGPVAHPVESPAPGAVEETNLDTSFALPPARLEQGRLTVMHNEQQQVKSCKVVVRNTGGDTARGVRVNFEFEDGTIIPGEGPASLAGKGEGTYFIARNVLPLTIKKKKAGASDSPEVEPAAPPRPKVIIQSDVN